MSPDHLLKIAELHAALGQAYREAAGDPPSNAAPMPKPQPAPTPKAKRTRQPYRPPEPVSDLAKARAKQIARQKGMALIGS